MVHSFFRLIVGVFSLCLLPCFAMSQSINWPEFSPGSAKEYGISTRGLGNPKYNADLAMDADGNPIVYWGHNYSGGDSYAYARRWNGSIWELLGYRSAVGQGIAQANARPNQITIDPSDGKLILSYDHYRNFMLKFDGETWTPWAGGGIDDSGGLEFFTTVDFMPDGTPVAAIRHGVGSLDYHVRVYKYVNELWQPFSPGSASGNGLAVTSQQISILQPKMRITKTGEIFLAWSQDYLDSHQVFAMHWDGAAWNDMSGMINARATYGRMLELDAEDRPMLVFYNEQSVFFTRHNGIRWTGIENPSQSADLISDPIRKSAQPVATLDSENYPMVIWQDIHSEALFAKRFNGTQWEPAGWDATHTLGIAKGHKHDALRLHDGRVLLSYVDQYYNAVHVRQFDPNIQPETPYETPTPVPPLTPTPTKTPLPIVQFPTPAYTPIPASPDYNVWFILDGYGGVHSSHPQIPAPKFPYFAPFNIARDLERDPFGPGWYMLDGYGGIHTSMEGMVKPDDMPYFGFDIARSLEVKARDGRLEFYMLDGYGTIHTTDVEFDFGSLPWFGFDIARDLNYDDVLGWRVLDGFGVAHSSINPIPEIPLQGVWSTAPYLRSMVDFPGDSPIVMDAFGGFHTSPRAPASKQVRGYPLDFYFPGFDILWDIEYVGLLADNLGSDGSSP